VNKLRNHFLEKIMKPFLAFTLCLTLALLGTANPTFAQYGKATQQNTPTAAPKTQDENSGVRHYKEPIAPTQPAKTKPAAAPAPAFTMPKGSNISIYYDDFSIRKTMGGQIFCQMTFYVENNTKMNLDALTLHMKWSGIATNLNIGSIPANDLKPSRYALVGKGCYTMGDTPELDISKCAMRSFTTDGRIIDVPENQCKSIVVFK